MDTTLAQILNELVRVVGENAQQKAAIAALEEKLKSREVKDEGRGPEDAGE